MMQKPLSIVCCTPFYGENWKWFVPELGEGSINWHFLDDRPRLPWEKYIVRPYVAMIRICLQAVLFMKLKPVDLLITHDSRVSFWCAYFAAKLGVKTKHIAYSFNFADMPQGKKRQLMTEAFSNINQFFVYSQLEKQLYHDYFGIPKERIEVVFWCMRVPEVRPENPLIVGDYICAIGGNARDYKTLMAAMEKLPDIQLVLVTRPKNLHQLKIPPNVKFMVNIPQEEAMNIIKYSRFMVLPLLGSEIPCGHVTLVAAMHLSKAFIITNSRGISDYVINDYNAVTCEAFQPAALADSIQTLWDDPDRCEYLGENGRQFAQTHCSEKPGVKYMQQLIWGENT